MADSHVTKNAFADALKELMHEKNFDKISVGDVCEKCGRNRKSFYYHFKDKYDLVNWIFDTQLQELTTQKEYREIGDMLGDLCWLFYDNRLFYRKALRIKGQNSFSDHFREFLYRIIARELQSFLDVSVVPMFQANFFADALVVTFQRWILEYDAMTPEQFMVQINKCMEYLTVGNDNLKISDRRLL